MSAGVDSGKGLRLRTVSAGQSACAARRIYISQRKSVISPLNYAVSAGRY